MSWNFVKSPKKNFTSMKIGNEYYKQWLSISISREENYTNYSVRVILTLTIHT